MPEIGIGQDAGSLIAAFRFNENTSRNDADGTFENRHVLVHDEMADPRLAQQSADKAQGNDIIGAEQFDHSNSVSIVQTQSFCAASCRAGAAILLCMSYNPIERLSVKDRKEIVLAQAAEKLNVRSAPRIEPLMDAVRPGMGAVNDLILSRTGSDVELIPELANHLIDSGGKRLRPMLTLATAQAYGDTSEARVLLAASVEFMHTATLLHDDVVDESDLRRGKPAARLVWGNQASVLVGDFLLGQAFKMMVEAGSLDALGVLSDASAIIAEGEVMQLITAQNLATTEEDYLKVIDAKTAALFAAAAEVGPILGNAGNEARAAMRDFGRSLGIAFQLVDDAIDYDSESGESGKEKGDDFREGKMTLPVILAYARGNEEERTFWRDAIAGFRTEDEDLAHAVTLINRDGTVAATRERAHYFVQRAIDAIACFPAGEARSAMAEAARFAVARRY